MINVGGYGVEFFFMISGFLILVSLIWYGLLVWFFFDWVLCIMLVFVVLYFVLFVFGLIVVYKFFCDIDVMNYFVIFMVNLFFL